MILALTTRHQPATDLGFLLHKHPAKMHQKTLNFGVATVFYPQATADIATAVLVVDIDPIGLVRRDNESFALSQYVNDRPYAASSFLSVAIGACFALALIKAWTKCRSRSNGGTLISPRILPSISVVVLRSMTQRRFIVMPLKRRRRMPLETRSSNPSCERFFPRCPRETVL